MSDIIVSLETALDQVWQELRTIQRVGRALTPDDHARVFRLQRVASLVQEALYALGHPAQPETVEPAPDEPSPPAEPEPGITRGGATGDALGRHDLEMMEGGLGGSDDTDDY